MCRCLLPHHRWLVVRQPATAVQPAQPARRLLLALALGASLARAESPGDALRPSADAPAGRVMFEGQWFDRQMRLQDWDLQLNGTGVRQVAWFRGYLAALYLATPARTAEQAVAAAGAKRIQLRLLHEVAAVEFSKAVRKGMVRNAAPAQQATLAERIDGFVRQIDSLGKVREKDTVDLDFLPGTGLVMRLNGRAVGAPVPGADFYAVLLLSFVGNRPYDKAMRAGLLGRPG